MFFGQDTFGERVGIVLCKYRNGTLKNDDAVVQMLVDKVDGAAGPLHAILEGLLLGIEPCECRKQRT